MKITRVRKVSNPRGAKRKKNTRRKLSAKQIKAGFGGARARAAAKAALKRKRGRPAAKKHHPRSRPNPKRRVRRVSTARPNPKRRVRKTRPNPAPKPRRKAVSNRRRKTRKSRSNPSVAVLGFLNPHRPKSRSNKRRVSTMAKARKNRRRVAVAAKPNRRRRHHHTRNPATRGRRRNPVLGYGTKTLIEMGGGVLAGVWATRLIPTLGPLASIASGSTAAATGVSIASAITAGIIAAKIRPDFGKGVLLGGLAEAFTVLLDAFVPPVGAAIGLRGMGYFAPAQFSIPQSPFYGQQGSGMAGLARPAARAYPKAY